MGYDIQYQVIGTGVWNTWSVTENRYDTSDVLDGWEIEFMIRTSNGDTVKSEVGMLILTLPSLLYSLLVNNLLASETSFCRFRASKSLDPLYYKVLTMDAIVVNHSRSRMPPTDPWTTP
jgi:hypothetical protein